MIALLVDIGNSRVKWRIAEIAPSAEALQPYRWLTEEQALALSELPALRDRLRVDAGCAVQSIHFSNVASPVAEVAMLAAAAAVWGERTAHRVTPVARGCGVANRYVDPAQLGPDRWLAMIGAHAALPDRSLLICSFGTATTIDLLVAEADSSATFVGGLILPGFEAMRVSLSDTTARLPLATGGIVAFATNTDDAIASGVATAQAGAVERALRQSREATGSSRPIHCVLAGGSATIVASLLEATDAGFEVVHDLVLRGLATVAAARIPTT